jgi:hypothetical protein
MKYKFRFKRDRFACRIPLKDKTFENVDVSNGLYETDNQEVSDYLVMRSKEANSDIISLNSVTETLDIQSSQPKIVSGARSSKNSEGEHK